MRGLGSSWLAWLLAACCWLSAGAVRAQSLIDLAAVTGHLDLSSQVELLEDEAAALAPAQALARGDWRLASPAGLKPGVTDAAIWLRLGVENRSDRVQTRWLTLGNPRLEEVRYYRFAPGAGEPLEQAVSGLAHPLQDRAETGLVSIFPVRLVPGESAELLLRVSGRTRLLLAPDLWEPSFYRVHEADLTVTQLVPICALLGLVLYMFVHALARRTPIMLLFVAWLASIGLYQLSFGGYLYRFWLQSGGEAAVRSTVILANLGLMLGAGFTLLFLRLYQQRCWRWIYLLYLACGLFQLVQSSGGDLRLANRLTVPLLMAFMTVWLLSIAAAWRRGTTNAGIFLLASIGLCGGVLWRIAEQQDWWLVELSSDSMFLQPSLMLGLAMVYGVVRSSLLEQRALREAQARLLKTRQDEHVRLESLVLERTRNLQDAVIAADEARRARSELLARVNHDLRRPATEILELAAPLERAGGEPADYGDAIRRSASDLRELIDDLIEEAGADHPLGVIRPEPVDIRSLFDGLAVEAEGLALANGNAFAWKPGPSLALRLLADPKRLRQVLINLLDNAAKFTQGGRVELQVDAASSGGLATLTCSVRDTGIGMSADQLAEVFEPYHRAEESRDLPGLGLGLAIARHWVERMGGSIVAESTPGQGTTMKVTLCLPLAPERPEPAATGPLLPTAGLAGPDAHSLALARDCLRLGAISDLLDWAADLEQLQPECRAFARCVADLAARGDLGTLAACLQPVLENEAAVPPEGMES